MLVDGGADRWQPPPVGTNTAAASAQLLSSGELYISLVSEGANYADPPAANLTGSWGANASVVAPLLTTSLSDASGSSGEVAAVVVAECQPNSVAGFAVCATTLSTSSSITCSSCSLDLGMKLKMLINTLISKPK